MEGDNAPQRLRRPLTVAVVNDVELVLRGLAVMLRPFSERVRVVELTVADTPDRRVDVVLFDTTSVQSADDARDRLRSMIDDRRFEHVVVYTWNPRDEVARAAERYGAAGVVSKSEPAHRIVELLEAIVAGGAVEHRVADVRPSRVDDRLTQREREVLDLVARGCPNRVIADQLCISLDTVKTHVSRLLRKLGASNRTQLALRAVTPAPTELRARAQSVTAAGGGR